jgi:hypothetical protein
MAADAETPQDIFREKLDTYLNALIGKVEGDMESTMDVINTRIAVEQFMAERRLTKDEMNTIIDDVFGGAKVPERSQSITDARKDLKTQSNKFKGAKRRSSRHRRYRKRSHRR